ncbi:hypothetical protein ACEPAH_9513 [Sanghuangporus vaninii]
MAQLPPSAVFGSSRPGQAVHVLLLIENSLPMVEHWQDLQQHILPGVLGAVRIANPGINVQIFWETTGKTQDQRPAYKSQRHFNDFPDIDIVGLPQNKLSPLFIRRSIDLFLSGDSSKAPITRHLFIVAVSNPIDDLPEKSVHPHQQTQPEVEKWDTVTTRLQESGIILHVIANPLVRLTRLFEVFRKTMRFQSRQEVIPWQPVDSTHCICHLSGSSKYTEKQSNPADQWPEVQLPSDAPSSPTANSPPDISDEEISTPISPIDMINSSSGSLSLVSRMQALHGLASRRRPTERSRRPSVLRSSFFRETSPTPSPRRERLINSKNKQNGNNAMDEENERFRQLSMVALSPTQPAASFSSALDLRGLTQDLPTHTQPDSRFTGGQGYPTAIATSDPSPQGTTNLLPPSPGSDASCSTMSSSIQSLGSVSRPSADLSNNGAGDQLPARSAYPANRPVQPPLYTLRLAGTSHSQSAPYQMVPGSASPTASAASNIPLPMSPTIMQSPIHGPTHDAFNGLPLPTFSSFSTPPYPAFGPPPPHQGIPYYLGSAEPISVGGSVPSEVEDDCESEVVPPSAPPDARGQVPFVFDPTYEAQNMLRLRQAINSMHETGNVRAAGPSNTSDLASGSWKGHGNTRTSSYIPELPDTFYSVDRGRGDDRQTGSYFASSGDLKTASGGGSGAAKTPTTTEAAAPACRPSPRATRTASTAQNVFNAVEDSDNDLIRAEISKIEVTVIDE